MGRDSIPQKILKMLFARSYNRCAFPGCEATIVDPKEDVVYGEVFNGGDPLSYHHDAKELR